MQSDKRFRWIVEYINNHKLGEIITMSRIEREIREEYGEISRIGIIRGLRWLEKFNIISTIPKEMWMKENNFGRTSKTYIILKKFKVKV